MKTLNQTLDLCDVEMATTELDAVGFEKYCENNGIHTSWSHVTINNYNDGYYKVQLPQFDNAEVIYYNGVFEMINE